MCIPSQMGSIQMFHHAKLLRGIALYGGGRFQAEERQFLLELEVVKNHYHSAIVRPCIKPKTMIK